MSLFGGSQAVSSDTSPAPLNLVKGDILDLTKVAPSLKNVVIGCGWHINARGADNYDLDISAFLLNKNGRVINPATNVVYFNQMNQQGIFLEGDNLTGSDGNDDDERIHVNLDDIAPDIEHIVFNVNIFEAQQKRQTFGMVKKSYIRILDKDRDDLEIARFELKENAGSSTAVTFGRLSRVNGGWQFEAIGDTLVVPDLNKLLIRYM